MQSSPLVGSLSTRRHRSIVLVVVLVVVLGQHREATRSFPPHKKPVPGSPGRVCCVRASG